MSMNEFTPELMELIDEHGNKRNFEIVDAVVLDGEQYFSLIPDVEDENFLRLNPDPIILKVVEENGEEVLASIDDEDEFEEVYNYFVSNAEENYNSSYDYDEYDDDEL